jgi:hypothetical protein
LPSGVFPCGFIPAAFHRSSRTFQVWRMPRLTGETSQPQSLQGHKIARESQISLRLRGIVVLPLPLERPGPRPDDRPATVAAAGDSLVLAIAEASHSVNSSIVCWSAHIARRRATQRAFAPSLERRKTIRASMVRGRRPTPSRCRPSSGASSPPCGMPRSPQRWRVPIAYHTAPTSACPCGQSRAPWILLRVPGT